MNIKTGLELEKQNILKKRTLAENQLKQYPPGMIRFNKNGNGTKWRQVFGDRPGRIISKKDTEKAGQLAHKKYLTDTIKVYDDQCRLIDAFLEHYPKPLSFPDHVNDDCKDYHTLLEPFFKRPDYIENWLSENYYKRHQLTGLY